MRLSSPPRPPHRSVTIGRSVYGHLPHPQKSFGRGAVPSVRFPCSSPSPVVLSPKKRLLSVQFNGTATQMEVIRIEHAGTYHRKFEGSQDRH
jgi:hypothetical protein